MFFGSLPIAVKNAALGMCAAAAIALTLTANSRTAWAQSCNHTYALKNWSNNAVIEFHYRQPSSIEWTVIQFTPFVISGRDGEILLQESGPVEFKVVISGGKALPGFVPEICNFGEIDVLNDRVQIK